MVQTRRQTKLKGGLAPLAIGLLGALGAPIATAAGQETLKGIKYLVKKLRGKGVLRSGETRYPVKVMTRKTGAGKKKLVGKKPKH